MDEQYIETLATERMARAKIWLDRITTEIGVPHSCESIAIVLVYDDGNSVTIQASEMQEIPPPVKTTNRLKALVDRVIGGQK